MAPSEFELEVARELAVLGTKLDTWMQEQRNLNDGLKRWAYGMTGSNGMNGDVRDLKAWRTNVEREVTQMREESAAAFQRLEKAIAAKGKVWRDLWLKTAVPVLVTLILTGAGQWVWTRLTSG